MRAHNPNGTSIGSAVFAQMTAECLYCLQWFACFPLKIAPFHVGIWTSMSRKVLSCMELAGQANELIPTVRISDVKRFPVYRLSFIFLVLVFEFQKPIIISNLALSSRLKDASPRSVAIGRLGSLTDTSRWSA